MNQFTDHRLLRGEYTFIVAAHTDPYIFCSTALDCTHKFRNAWNFSRLVAEISDEPCREHQFSVICIRKTKQFRAISEKVILQSWLPAIAANDDERHLRMQPNDFDALMIVIKKQDA